MSKDGTKYSIKPIDDEYHTYSEGICVKYPGYKLDKNYIVMNVDDREINLEQHIAYMLSKTQKVHDQYENLKAYVFPTNARFLAPQKFPAISYSSYPRSGNTFLRTYLENITGVATGSD